MVVLAKEINSEKLTLTSCPQEDAQFRWLTSKNMSCSIEVGQKCKVANLTVHVEEKVGVPAEEQNLCLGSRELLAMENMSSLSTKNIELVRTKNDPRNTNLASFHKYVEMKTLDIGQFTYVQKIGEGAGASVFKYMWNSSGLGGSTDVAVKKVSKQAITTIRGKETNERMCHMDPDRYLRKTEDPLAEIGILQYLAAQKDVSDYLLRVLSILEDTNHVWIVTELADGGDLFDLASEGNPGDDDIFRFLWQLLQALAYLHQHYIGHRDVSLENLALKNGTVKLMDFGAAVRSHSASGQLLRYFRRGGKPFYSAPECYVPHTAAVAILAPENAIPDSIALVPVNNRLVEVRLPIGVVPGRPCAAEVWGYSVPSADIFSAGVCLFMLLFRTSAFYVATLEDANFSVLHYKQKAGLKNLLKGWNIPFPSKNTLQLLCVMLASDPSQRPSAVECLRSPLFENFGPISIC